MTFMFRYSTCANRAKSLTGPAEIISSNEAARSDFMLLLADSNTAWSDPSFVSDFNIRVVVDMSKDGISKEIIYETTKVVHRPDIRGAVDAVTFARASEFPCVIYADNADLTIAVCMYFLVACGYTSPDAKKQIESKYPLKNPAINSDLIARLDNLHREMNVLVERNRATVCNLIERILLMPTSNT